jgi:hypothetical protein
VIFFMAFLNCLAVVSMELETQAIQMQHPSSTSRADHYGNHWLCHEPVPHGKDRFTLGKQFVVRHSRQSTHVKQVYDIGLVCLEPPLMLTTECR